MQYQTKKICRYEQCVGDRRRLGWEWTGWGREWSAVSPGLRLFCRLELSRHSLWCEAHGKRIVLYKALAIVRGALHWQSPLAICDDGGELRVAGASPGHQPGLSGWC